jgi:inhibitor of cysteine peptidase
MQMKTDARLNQIVAFGVFAAALFVSGCAGAASSDDDTVSSPTNDPNAPVSSDDPIQPTPEPTPIEGEVITGEATVGSVDILILESFPVQIRVLAKGTLSDACTTIHEITQEREGDTFTVTITTIRPADMMCAQVLTPFEESIPLDVQGLKAGTYTVDVNGETATFTLDVDNILQ